MLEGKVWGGRFVVLDQINRDNVSKLAPAWTYHIGAMAISDGNGAEDQMTPLQVGDRVFICTPHNNLIALDPDTGEYCQGFGKNGQVELKVGLGNVPKAYYQLSSAPLIYAGHSTCRCNQA